MPHLAPPSTLPCLGIDADEGQPFYEGFSLPAGLPAGQRPLRPGISSSRLHEAGWAVIFPRSIDSRIREALAPLLRHRREQAGPLYRELTYFPREGSGHFLSRLRAGPGPVAPRDLPYYLLLVGNAAEIPLEFQYQLGVQFAVGRLHLGDTQAYANYARSVVESELAARFEGRRPLDFFSVGHPRDPATDLARFELVAPLRRHLGRRFVNLDTRRIDGAAADKSTLDSIVHGGDSSLLLTVSHAALFKPESQRHKPCQGALVCADWPGTGPAISSQYFSALDLRDEAELTGRIFMLFGCHTAGTPRLDTYGPSGPGSRQQRRELADAPFFSRLPQALLGHPAGGALAVIAHIDRAYPVHTFGDHVDGQCRSFEDVLFQLLRDRPVGHAMASFGLRHAELAARLLPQALEAGDGAIDAFDRQALWLAYGDARSHVVLGDPAVRLGELGLTVRGPEIGGKSCPG